MNSKEYSPELELYQESWMNLISLDESVFPSLPDESDYPFIHLHSTNMYDERVIKGIASGRAVIRADIWHNDVDEIGTVLNLAHRVKNALMRIEKTTHYQWRVLPYGVGTTNLIDRTTSKKLRHYTISIEFRYNERG